jgi:GxxExxY protein
MKTYHLAESDRICGLAWEVWHNLGSGFTREIYADALEQEFIGAGIPYRREQNIPVYYKDILLPHSFTAEFLVYDKIILGVQAQKEITETEWRRVASMVSASKLHLGIHINYAFKGPEFKRVVVQTKFLNSMNVHEISEDISTKEAV